MKNNNFRFFHFLHEYLHYPSNLILSIFLVATLFLPSCSKDSGTNIDNSGGRYQYPNYIDGFVTISHSWYKVCEDNNYDNSSKKFFAGDTIFASISEVLGPDLQTPELQLYEIAEIICSNGDVEKFIFNYPYPQCVTHIDGVLLRFSGVKTRSSIDIITDNNFVDIKKDTVILVTYYKSYWTGNIVTDTAFIFPKN